jgi:hypothetical protein
MRFRFLVSISCLGIVSACLSVAPVGTSFLCNAATGADCDAGVADAGMSFSTAPHSAWPQLVNDGGTVIASPRLVTIAASNDALAENFFDFADSIVASPWLAQVGGEYGVGRATSGGHFLGPALGNPDGGSTSLTWTQYLDYVQGVINSGAPAPNGQTVYLVFMPSGISYDGKFSSALWSSFPDPNSQGDMMLVMFRGTPLSGENQFDEMTVATTDHLIGLLTDPWAPLGPGWMLVQATPPWAGDVWAAISGEWVRVGDLCSDDRILEAGSGSSYAFARSWSNAAALRGGDPCVPAVDRPYYNVSFQEQWLAVSPGQSVSIPFSGWSTEATPDWWVYPYLGQTQGGFSSLTTTSLSISSPLGEEPIGNCTPKQSLNNGVTAMLQLTVPATAKSGDFAVLGVFSVYEDPVLCADPPTSSGDAKHHQVVGIYVP